MAKKDTTGNKISCQLLVFSAKYFKKNIKKTQRTQRKTKIHDSFNIGDICVRFVSLC